MKSSNGDVVELTSTLIAMPSPSQVSNIGIVDLLDEWFTTNDFEIERLAYTDEAGERKESLVALRGSGRPGIGFFSHSDTVPGGEGWAPYTARVEGGRLFGRGACDMKGPLAATMLAAASYPTSELERSVAVVVTADEEVGFGGAIQVLEESRLLDERGWPHFGVIAEPTELTPVYAHKGGHFIKVTAHGTAAHTSTDRGTSANFLIAPFLAEMAELATVFRTDPQYRDERFNPPTNGFNLVFSDGGCAANVTAARTEATLSFRDMPGVDSQKTLEQIVKRAEAHGLEVEVNGRAAFFTDPDSELIRACIDATGASKAKTVPFGTEALVFQEKLPQVILGPGNIAQAHTVGEFVDIDELVHSVDVYRNLIARFAK